MATFTEDGKLKELQISDLIAVLSTLPEEEKIDIYDGFYCLGARAASLALKHTTGDDSAVQHGIYYGTVYGKDERYEYDASLAAGGFIEKMLGAQDNVNIGYLTAGELARELDTYVNTTVFANGWQEPE